MRRFFLGQVLATIAVAVMVLLAFTVFGVWQKPLEARIAAMGIALLFGGYPSIILFRLLVHQRDWDRPLDVAFAAAVLALIAMTGLGGAILGISIVSVVSLVVGARALKSFQSGDRRWSWQHPEYLLWGQFLATLALIFLIFVQGGGK
ncbi:MAG: hypothetical protein WD940_01105 [Patescibacteria group bacterium]